MSLWLPRILKEFPSDVARFWIAADPDGVLLEQEVLSALRERGFEILPFEDSIAFRADFEERYRSPWDRGQEGPARALMLHFRGTRIDELPWDYLQRGRQANLSLAELFPGLSYPVIRQLDSELRPVLMDAAAEHARQPLGESATKEFLLTHIYGISPHLIVRPQDFWRELLRLHYRELALPAVLAEHVAQVVGKRAAFAGLPIADLFSQKVLTLRVVQEAWYRFLKRLGVQGTRSAESSPADYVAEVEIPFEHHDVRSHVDSMFLDGTLHPLLVDGVPRGIPEWAKVGVVQDPAALRNLVHEGVKSLMQEIPSEDSPYRDWTHFARRMAEIQSRCHSLDASRAESVKVELSGLVRQADDRLRSWVGKHYEDLPSLPAAKAPVMVHHVPRYLSMRRSAGEQKIALLVFDGLALDQWANVREGVMRRSQGYVFDENACFAWLPTLTSISRQALFSGLRPREFEKSIESTSQEPGLWVRFWQDQGLKASEVSYRKSIKRNEDLPALEEALSDPSVRVAGVVIDTVDEIVHGAVLGKRGIAKQIDDWCESGFVNRLFDMLFEKGFHVYLTADHGNVEAVGIGRPKEGVASEMRGERARVYRSEALRAETLSAIAGSYGLHIGGLPSTFLPVIASGQGAFVTAGHHAVVHGGSSVEELIVPFVKVVRVN